MRAKYLTGYPSLGGRLADLCEADDLVHAVCGGTLLTAVEEQQCDAAIRRACLAVRSARQERGAGRNPLDDAASGRCIDLATLQRIERLLALGRSRESIFRELGLDEETVERVAAGIHPLQRTPTWTRCAGCGGQVRRGRRCGLCRARSRAA